VLSVRSLSRKKKERERSKRYWKVGWARKRRRWAGERRKRGRERDMGRRRREVGLGWSVERKAQEGGEGFVLFKTSFSSFENCFANDLKSS
jgi:hypothetical protein